MPPEYDDWLALKECCKDEAAFLRLQQLLTAMPRDQAASSSTPPHVEPSVQTAVPILPEQAAHRPAWWDAIPDLMFRIRRDGTYLEVKADRLTHLALPPEQMVGRRVVEVLPPPIAQQRMAYIERALQTGQLQTYEYQLLVQGEWRDYEARIVVYGPDEVLAIMRNITGRKQIERALRASEQKFSLAFHNSRTAISLTKLQTGEFVEVNESFCRISGFDRAEIIGATSINLGLWVDLECRNWMLQQLQQYSAVQNVELDFRRKSGEFGVALMSAEVIELNEQQYMLGTIHDITHLKAAQVQLQSINASLEHQVEERTLELQQKMQQLQELSQLQEEFLHAVSHDLRTPLLGMTLVMKNLLQKAGGRGQATSGSVMMPGVVLERMIQSCDRQLKLINSILEAHVSETRGLVLQLERVSLGQLVQEIEQDMAPLMVELQATLINQVPRQLPAVMADPLQLRRVFENLLNNALQHNPPGLTLTLTAQVMSHQIYLQLQDNGVGLEAEMGDRLFDRYVQGAGKRQSTGLGLGLYLCRQIMSAHGGEIGVNSLVGRGATFWFTLPLPG
jgi:PAS domain S-box-containing protein